MTGTQRSVSTPARCTGQRRRIASGSWSSGATRTGSTCSPVWTARGSAACCPDSFATADGRVLALVIEADGRPHDLADRDGLERHRRRASDPANERLQPAPARPKAAPLMWWRDCYRTALLHIDHRRPRPLSRRRWRSEQSALFGWVAPRAPLLEPLRFLRAR